MQNYLALEQMAVTEQAARLAQARHDALVREARAGGRDRSGSLTRGRGSLALLRGGVELLGVLFGVVLGAVAELLHRVRDVPVAPRVARDRVEDAVA